MTVKGTEDKEKLIEMRRMEAKSLIQYKFKDNK